MAIVTTGQITIVDQNDARPITGTITANPGPQQVYTKDESTVSYLPDWPAANGATGIILTPKVYLGGIGGATDITNLLTNRKFTTDLGTAIVGTAATIASNASLSPLFVNASGTYTTVLSGAASTLTIKANLIPTVPQVIIYFEGDYVDPVSSLSSHVVLQLTLGVIKTGTNAVFVLMRGQSAIAESTGATKNVVAMSADLIRAAAVDDSGVTYKWYNGNGAVQIINSGAFNTKYGVKTVAAGPSPVGVLGDIGVNLGSGWLAFNTLVIHEDAVNDMENFRVEAKDADGTIYQTFFTITDFSDPYDVKVTSSTGDKLQNGIGSTVLTPRVYNGATEVTPLTGWTFTWTFYNKDGNRGGFIDATKTAQAGGRNITAHGTGASATITYDGANFASFNIAGGIVKVVTPLGVDKFYEVLSNVAGVVTIRTPVTNTWLNYTTFPAPTASEFVGGKIYCVIAGGGQLSTSAGATITVTGDEVDAKCRISVDADRP